MKCETVEPASFVLTPFRQQDGTVCLVKGGVFEGRVIVEGDVAVGTYLEVMYARAFLGLESNFSLEGVPDNIVDAALQFLPKLPKYRAALVARMTGSGKKTERRYRKEQSDIQSYLDRKKNVKVEPLGGIIVGNSYRWPNGRIPYLIDPALPQKSRVTDAIGHWQAKTRIRFVALTPSDKDGIKFVDGSVCESYIGRRGGIQNIVVGSGCSVGNVKHEIGHAVGLYHEHCRNDRDAFVEIKWPNILSEARSNYQRYGSSGSDMGAYDYGSIMHYGKLAPSHAVDPAKPVLVPKGTPEPAIGQRDALSSGDISAVGTMYP